MSAVDPVRMIEKQSGFLRLLLYLDEHGEQSITQILEGSGIPVHQLYASIEMAKKWKLVSSRIDASSYPNRNLISITEKGKKSSGRLIEFLVIISSG